MNSLSLASVVLASVSGLAAAQPARQPVVNVDWRGGTVAEYVSMLRGNAAEAPVNVVVDAIVADWRVAPLKLQGVTVVQALQAAASAAKTDQGGRAVLDDHTTPDDSLGAGFAVLTAVNPTRAQAQMQLGVLPLRQLTEGQPGEPAGLAMEVDTILGAVQAGLPLADADGRPAVLKFHQDSSLLMLQGDGAEIDAAERIVSLLERDLRDRRNRLRESQSNQLEQRLRGIEEASRNDSEVALIELNAERRRAELAMRSSEAEVQAISTDLDRLRKLHERGMTSDAELRQSELAYKQAQINAELAATEMSRLDDRLQLAKARAAGGDDSRILESRLDALTRRREEMQAAIGPAHDRLEALSRRRGVDVSDGQIEESHNAVARMEADFDALQREIEDLEARRAAAKAESAKGEADAERARVEAEAFHRQLVEMQVRNDAFQQQLEFERANRAELERRIASLVEELTRARVQIETLQKAAGDR